MAASPEMLVCQALQAATDTNHEVVRKAEAQLGEWEQQQGFFLTLARLCMTGNSQQLDVNVRWMAAVYLKNGINKYWRRGSRQELPQEEKQQIRDMLLGHFTVEPVPQVALQVAVLMARIARSDCPREWPELVPQLLKRLQATAEESTQTGEQQRILLVLHHVIKALASRRMMSERATFGALATTIYEYMQDMWNALTTLFFHQLNTLPDTTIARATLERALLALRILRKLTIYGFGKPHKWEYCMRFLEQMFERLKQCLQCRYELRHMGAEEQLIALLEKFTLKQMKTLNEFQDMHASSFVRFVPAALDFSFDHVFHAGARLIFTDNVINFRNFAIHCINLMKSIMTCSVYAPLADNSADPDVTPSISLEEFFTNERLCYICEKIITHYFLLTQIELDMWAEDPEGFAQDDGGESWKYALRPCVETLYLTCFTQYQAQMTAEVVKYIRKAQQTQLAPTSDLKDILLKDAIYNAAGLASFYFFIDVDFDAWFSGQLLAELRIDTDNFRILRRRIIWLVAEWVAVKFSRELRPLAYEACLHLLQSKEDMSIRLAASRTLSALTGDFEFWPEPFLPYLESAFNLLFALLRDAHECDTKMNVLNTMSLIVEKMSDHTEPQAENLVAYLPLLWKESEDYNMLRCAIICTLQQLVKAIRDIPDQMKPFLYSVIEISTDLQEPSHVYLMEEGLSLWLAVVENSTAMSPQLIGLCKNLLPIIEMSSENLRTILVIINANILLDAHAYLERYGRPFVEFCIRMFNDMRAEGIVLMLKVLETCLKSDANYGLELVRPALPYIFKQVYLNKDFPMLLGMYLMMVARVLLISQSTFTEVVQELQLDNALETIMDVWIVKMPLVTEMEMRKLFCLAFASIFSNVPLVLTRFPGIMQNIGDTLELIMREEDDVPEEPPDGAATDNTSGGADNSAVAAADAGIGASGGGGGGDGGEGLPFVKYSEWQPLVKYTDYLVFQDEHDAYCSMDDFDYKSYHYDRSRQLLLKDPVHKIILAEYVEFQLYALRTQMGDDQYQRLMKSVCPRVLKKMYHYLRLNLDTRPK